MDKQKVRQISSAFVTIVVLAGGSLSITLIVAVYERYERSRVLEVLDRRMRIEGSEPPTPVQSSDPDANRDAGNTSGQLPPWPAQTERCTAEAEAALRAQDLGEDGHTFVAGAACRGSHVVAIRVEVHQRSRRRMPELRGMLVVDGRNDIEGGVAVARRFFDLLGDGEVRRPPLGADRLEERIKAVIDEVFRERFYQDY